MLNSMCEREVHGVEPDAVGSDAHAVLTQSHTAQKVAASRHIMAVWCSQRVKVSDLALS